MAFPLFGAALGAIGGAITNAAQRKQAEADTKLNAALMRDSYILPENMASMRQVQKPGSMFGDIVGQGLLGGVQQAQLMNLPGVGGPATQIADTQMGSDILSQQQKTASDLGDPFGGLFQKKPTFYGDAVKSIVGRTT